MASGAGELRRSGRPTALPARLNDFELKFSIYQERISVDEKLLDCVVVAGDGGEAGERGEDGREKTSQPQLPPAQAQGLELDTMGYWVVENVLFVKRCRDHQPRLRVNWRNHKSAECGF